MSERHIRTLFWLSRKYVIGFISAIEKKIFFKLRSRRVVSSSKSLMRSCTCAKSRSVTSYFPLKWFSVVCWCGTERKHFLKLQFPWLKVHRFPSTRPPPRLVLQNHSNKTTKKYLTQHPVFTFNTNVLHSGAFVVVCAVNAVDREITVFCE